MPIEHVIRKKIKEEGVLDLAAFIDLALYHPQYGYYMTRDPFGVEGDFITAPEVSQMFGEVIGAWIADIWMQMGSPQKLVLVECGPGRGVFMADILRATANIKGFHNALSVKMIECSPVLRDKQKQALSFFAEVEWFDALENAGIGGPVIILGNEFLDAFPVQHYKREGSKTQKCVITLEDNDFIIDWQEVAYDCTAGALYETSPVQESFIEQCCGIIKENSGACLFIDYGYVEAKSGDTLQVLKNHKKVGLFDHIGDSDITAHVNFGKVKEQVQKVGANWHGVRTQGDFLQGLGIALRAQVLKNTALKSLPLDEAQVKQSGIDRDLKRLIGSKEMGELFKVACFSSGLEIRPAGF